MILEEKYFARYILLTDPISLSNSLYFLRYWVISEMEFDILTFEINLSFLSFPSFKFFLSNLSQSVSINGYNPDLAAMNFDVPRESALAPLLFLLYINGLKLFFGR